MDPTDYSKFLVLSLGTGAAKNEHFYNAKDAANWGSVQWIASIYTDSHPIIDVLQDGSANMVEIHLATIFEAFQAQDNYLRIQVQIPTNYYSLFLNLKKKEKTNKLPIGIIEYRNRVKAQWYCCVCIVYFLVYRM